MKRQLLFTMLCIVGALSLNAQIKEVDMTSDFSSLTNWRNWTGATGYTATGFCPVVEVGGGIGMKQVCEKYEGSCNSTGEIFSTNVTGLTAGTYKIELYGGAAFTFGRGFASTAFTNGSGDSSTEYNENDKIDPPGTGVTLYAESEGVTYGGEIPIYYATKFPDGAAVITLDGIVVGSSGKIEIGMSKTSTSTNWHVIQLKSVIAQVDMADLIASKKSQLQSLVNEASPYSSDPAVSAAITEANELIGATPANVDEADALIANIDAAIASLPAKVAVAKNAASVAGASATNPISTNFVINGTFDTAGNVEPWKTTGSYQNVNTATNQQGAFNVPFFENWNPDAKANKMYQVIENIPNGVYELDICAFVETFAGDGQTSQFVFANNEKTYLTTGTPTAYKVFVEVTDNRLEVGFEQTDATSRWMGIDNVSLKYYGNCTIAEAQFGSYIATVREWKDKIAAVTALPPLMLSNTTDILNAISDTQSSVDDYEYVIGILTDLYDSVKESEAVYAEYTNIRNYVTALLAVPYVEKVAGAWDALDEANMDAETREAAKADERPNMSTIQDIYDAIFNLNHAAFQYVTDADPAVGSVFDITFFLTNPDVTKFWDGTWGIKPEGWLTDQNPADNFQVMSNNEMGPGGEVFIEYWSGSAKTSDFVLYQMVNLPEGNYSATGRVGLLQSDGGVDPNSNMTFSANDNDDVQLAVSTLTDYTVEFTNSTEDVVKIGVKAHEGNTYHWIGINNLHLYKQPVKSFFIDCLPGDDGSGTPVYSNYDSKTEGVGDVTLHRRLLAEDYNTLVLPFDMSADEVQEFFGNGTQVFFATSYDAVEDNISLTHDEDEGYVIKANVPCVIWPTEYKPEGLWFFPSRTLVPSDVDNPQYYGTNVTMEGNYLGNKVIAPSRNHVVLARPNENSRMALYYVDSEDDPTHDTRVFLHPTSCFFILDRSGAPVVPSGAKGISFTVDGKATGIATVENGEINFISGKIYDLSGREVKNPGRGIYIVGGKKVMIK